MYFCFFVLVDMGLGIFILFVCFKLLVDFVWSILKDDVFVEIVLLLYDFMLFYKEKCCCFLSFGCNFLNDNIFFIENVVVFLMNLVFMRNEVEYFVDFGLLSVMLLMEVVLFV